tara:strand:+ start:478 stop:1293 length:816 start_codon:yes stop_codon:yes gene_type:complete
MLVAFDFGITNTDVVVNKNSTNQFFSFPTQEINENFMTHIFDSINCDVANISKIAVTGGKSSDLKDKYENIKITKINEVDAIGFGAIAIYDIAEKPFVAVSAGTGTACIYHSDGNFNHLGGISVGGGTLQGLSRHLIGLSNPQDIQEFAEKGNRKKLDYLIGDVVNEIGSLYPEITASNFGKARSHENLSNSDVAASISNMVGEVIGTISYLNAMICNQDRVYFLGRVSLNKAIKTGIEDRLNLANIKGLFKDNREYGNVLGALNCIKTKK